MHMENKTKCPICLSNNLTLAINTKDYFLTNENYSILKCNTCGLHLTNPVPETGKLHTYYKSKKYYSHQNNSYSLMSVIYNLARNYAIKKKYRLIKKYFLTGKILDYGCGSGDFLLYLNRKGWNTYGLEPDINARSMALSKDIRVAADINELLSVTNDSFDVVTMWHVLEHIPDFVKVLNDLLNIMKKKSILVIAVPNNNSWDANYYKKYWAAWDVPRHLFHFNKENMKMLGEKLNLQLINVSPMSFDSYYVSLLSEKYKNRGFFSFFPAIVNGFYSNYKARHNMEYSSLIYTFRKMHPSQSF